MAQLPLPDAYRAAILTPSLCFSDPELRSARAYTNKRGLAVVWSGQFATVFRLLTPTKRMAVRCFISRISDQQERYARLHDHISGKRAPMLVEFQYQPKGIRVNGVWYPIVKMEWAEGVTLDQKVEDCVNRRDTATLKALAVQWSNLVFGLHELKVAHGDLQHENVLVSNGSLRLVDYDGAFVPSLAGKTALELGHPHYQHPLRKNSDFNLAIDNFSAIVIYLSLKAMSVDPSLWQKFHKDKHLLLRAEDYKAPQRSQVLMALKCSTDEEVSSLAAKLEASCTGQLNAVPALSSIIKPSRVINWRKTWTGMETITPFRITSQTSKRWQPRLLASILAVLKHHVQTLTRALRNIRPLNLWAWAAVALALLAIIPALHVLAGLAAVICGLIGRSVAGRFGQRGKRLASWAVGLGVLMIILSLPLQDVGSWLKSALRKRPTPVDDSYAISSLKANVTSFRLYESGSEELPLNKRDYGHIFTKSQTRYVNWEVYLQYPTAQRRIDFTLDTFWYRGDGGLLTQQTLRTYVEAGWNSSFHSFRWGAQRWGNWQTGSYRIELYADGKKIASDSFVIK